MLVCPSTIIKNVGINNQTSTNVYWDYKALSDDSGGVARLTCDPEWGSEFSTGRTNVTCTAFDDRNNNATCGFSVIVFCE